MRIRARDGYGSVPPGGLAAGNGRRVALGALALALAAGLGLVGCSSGEDRTPTYPVSGRVFVDDEPAAGAFVVFHPVGPASADTGRPTAQVRPDGSFVLTTFDEADGAPAGPYAVTVEWRKLIQKGGEAQAGPNVVPAEYSRPASTPLQVSVAEVPNTLEDFRIETRRKRR